MGRTKKNMGRSKKSNIIESLDVEEESSLEIVTGKSTATDKINSKKKRYVKDDYYYCITV